MSRLFQATPKEIKTNFTSEIKSIISLKNYHVFLYFKSAIYQIWNLRTNELIVSKTIEKGINKFCIINEKTLAYICFDGTLKILQLYGENEIVYFAASIPSPMAIQNNNMNANIEIFKTTLITQSIIYANQQNGLIYLLEKFPYSSLKIFHVISIYNLAITSQPLAQYPLEHEFPLQFSYLTQSSKFVLWDQFFLELPKSNNPKKKPKTPFLYIGEYINERLSIIAIDVLNSPNIKSQTNSTVVGIVETQDSSKLLFIENTNEQLPMIKVFDLENFLILRKITLPLESNTCITQTWTILPNLKNQKLFFEVESMQSQFCSLSLDKELKRLSNDGILNKHEDSSLSLDTFEGEYSLEIERQNIPGEAPYKEMDIDIKLIRSVKKRHLSLYFLSKLDTYHIYIHKMVYDFLPD